MPADERALAVPIRFQCPLCFDVLRRPILLPCCRRHLCTECFERALELTSVNCGFCRRRVVGFARTKRHKVDEALWRAILRQCPFLRNEADEMEDVAPPIEFVDEDAPPLHSQGEDHPTGDSAAKDAAQPGEIKAFYEQQLHAYQTRQREEEQRALQQTMAFLETDPEYRAAAAGPSSNESTPSAFRSLATQNSMASTGTGLSRRRDAAGSSVALRPRSSRGQRPASRSKGHIDSKQQRLDLFLAPSRIITRSMTPDPQDDLDMHSANDPAASEDDEHPHKPRQHQHPEHHRRDEEDPSTPTSPRTRSQTRSREMDAMLITRHNHYPRGTSQSPKNHTSSSSKSLLQTTLIARTRSSESNGNDSDSAGKTQRASSETRLVVTARTPKNGRATKKMLTRQGSRRAWKCPSCTFENTCFDSRCSMCHSIPPSSAYIPL